MKTPINIETSNFPLKGIIWIQNKTKFHKDRRLYKILKIKIVNGENENNGIVNGQTKHLRVHVYRNLFSSTHPLKFGALV